MDKIMEYPVATLRQLRILKGINEPYCSVQTGVSSQNILKSLPKGDLLFLQKPTLNRPMIHPKPTFKSDKSKQKVALIIGNIFRCTILVNTWLDMHIRALFFYLKISQCILRLVK